MQGGAAVRSRVLGAPGSRVRGKGCALQAAVSAAPQGGRAAWHSKARQRLMMPAGVPRAAPRRVGVARTTLQRACRCWRVLYYNAVMERWLCRQQAGAVPRLRRRARGCVLLQGPNPALPPQPGTSRRCVSAELTGHLRARSAWRLARCARLTRKGLPDGSRPKAAGARVAAAAAAPSGCRQDWLPQPRATCMHRLDLAHSGRLTRY